ncbi:MAG: hypothetical protein ABJB86_02890 [Bacteroidota bacterium]
MIQKILFIAALFSATKGHAQGCIPVRNIAGFGQYNVTSNTFANTGWQLDINNRYFKSFRDFKEKTDLKTPEQNQSVNKVYTFDMLLTHFFTGGWSVALDVPITDNSRTSSVEHGGFNTQRHTTRSFGLGDIRFTVYKWLLTPTAGQKGNIQVGLGLKFATGDYNVKDYFYRNDSTKVLAAVNPSIQLGDGGTGIITALLGFYHINKTITLYGDFYYLVSPRNENGALYDMGKTATATQVKADAINTSVPDVFSLHAGAFLNIRKFSFSAAVRCEGSPVYDLTGGSDGTRRAGYYLSAEPGLLYTMKKITLFAYTPVVIDRKIAQNVPDKNTTAITGIYTVGPGGSANVAFYAGISCRF